MNITLENAVRLRELWESMVESFDKFRGICQDSMTKEEYRQFKYRTLGHIEPCLTEETEWFTEYDSRDSLEKIVTRAEEEQSEEEEE